MVFGLSEAKAAAAHGITLRTYQKWEAGGHHHGGHQKLLAFCKKYDVSLDWLYGGEARVIAGKAVQS
jgi:transcriptional regulator with XRE-family HTH domain